MSFFKRLFGRRKAQPSRELQSLLQEIASLTRLSDMPRHVQLCRQALDIVSRHQDAPLWAALQGVLGNSLVQNPLGVRADNLEQAIFHFQQALEVYTRQAFPVRWAQTLNNLANAYWKRIKGERAENLEQAIVHCQQALEVRTRQAFPKDWAMTQHNLANAYSDRIKGERAENLEQALTHYQQALTIQTLDKFPADHQKTQRNLGHLHFSERNWSAAQAAYARAIEAGQTLLAAAYTEAGRQAEVGETSRLYARAAYCLLQLDRPGQALHQLEQGKTRLLAEALALAEADLAMPTPFCSPLVGNGPPSTPISFTLRTWRLSSASGLGVWNDYTRYG